MKEGDFMNVVFIFTEVTQMEVPIDREIPLEKACLLLEKQNKIAQEQSIDMQFSYSLIVDGDVIYSSHLELPRENFSLYQTIYDQEFEQGTEGKELFLEWLNNAFSVKKMPRKKVKKAPKKEKAEKKETKDFSKIGKRVVIGLGICLSLFLLGIGSVVVYSNFSKPIPLETYLKEEKFIEAGNIFPDKHQVIENHLFDLTRSKDKRYLKELEQFNKKYETIQGSFDLAMFKAEYQEAITIYEKNKKAFDKDSVRLTVLGYAYLKEKEVGKAEGLLTDFDSTELEKYLYKYKQLTLFIQEKQDLIKQLEKEPTKNRKAIETAIDELFDAKEQLETF